MNRIIYNQITPQDLNYILIAIYNEQTKKNLKLL